MELTKDNYFTKENNYLSNSKISDWLVCKDYFKRKHIDHSIETDRTNAMIKGSIVDGLLTQDEIKTKYWVGDGRTKEAKDMKDAGMEVISETTYNEIMGMAIAVESTTAFRDLKDYVKQDIIQIDDPVGKHFQGLCGMIDFYKVEDDKCIIVDLKTAADIKTIKYHYHCEEFGYYRQMAMYMILLLSKYPKLIPPNFKFYHLVVEKKKDIWPIKTFELNWNKVMSSKSFLDEIIWEEISKETEFEKLDATWEMAEEIGGNIYEESL